MSDDIPATLKYTKDHEWAKEVGSEIRVGITKFAVEQLGDVTLVSVDVKEGGAVTVGKPFGSIESVKSTSDLFPPVNGKIGTINRALEDKPELVNEDCYGAAWLVTIVASNPKELEQLMDAGAYEAHVKTSAHA